MMFNEVKDTKKALWERAREFLMTRRTAYVRTFNFDAVHNQMVLKDLSKFCRANESTHGGSAEGSARLDGRREVWLRIQHHLRLNPDQLFKLYSGIDE